VAPVSGCGQVAIDQRFADGIAEVLTIAYGGSQVRDLVVYGLMILILLLRPQGLLGGARSDVGQRV
jgi:branched-chain amino acid transport system permease protein